MANVSNWALKAETLNHLLSSVPKRVVKREDNIYKKKKHFGMSGRSELKEMDIFNEYYDF